MSHRRRRLDRLRLLPVALLLGLGCEDSPNGAGAHYISIVEPLRMHWPGQDQGVPYTGGTTVFEAATALRVVWSFRIEGYTPDDRRPVYTQEFVNQDRIAFTWNGQSNFGFGDFAVGDSCVATVTFKQIDPAEADRARLAFVIGR